MSGRTREPISYGSIPGVTNGYCALQIYPPGAWMDSKGYCVFVGGSGRGERKTLAAAERYLLQCAKEYCENQITQARRNETHYMEQARRLTSGLVRESRP